MVSNYRYILYALHYLKNYRGKLIFVLATSILSILLALVPVEIFRRLIDVVIPNKDLKTVLFMVLVIFVIHVLLLVINYVQDLLLTKLSLDITRKMQGNLFISILHLSPHDYSQFQQGQLMERLIDDTEEIVGSMFDLVISPFLDIISIIITVIYMFTISVQLTFVSLALVPIFILMIVPVNRIVRKKYAAIKRSYAAIYSVIQDRLAHVREIVTKNKEKSETKAILRKLKTYNRLQYDYEKFSTKLESLISIVSDIAPYVVLIYATWLIIKGRFELGTLVAFLMLMPRLFGPVQELAGQELELQTLGVTARRVFSILKDGKPASRTNRK